MNDDPGFFETLLGDGRALFNVVAFALVASGGFAIFQAATGQFLPHDTAFLGMTSQQLCTLHGCRIVHFMIHDRVSFGGVLIAIAVMYLWLAEVPLKRGESWAWWALAASGGAGFLSFLAYIGYGYLDSWHGAATLVLLPVFVAALWRTRKLRVVRAPLPAPGGRHRIGRWMLLGATAGIVAAGLTITTVGATSVFVPTDLQFMGITRAEILAINARLVPLIAHDRAGFGGALVSCGIAMFFAVLRGRPSKSLWQALATAGAFGFATAIGVHPVIGYTNASHLAPAVLGALVFVSGLAATSPAFSARSRESSRRSMPGSDPAAASPSAADAP
jgi:hypothetical protein